MRYDACLASTKDADAPPGGLDSWLICAQNGKSLGRPDEELITVVNLTTRHALLVQMSRKADLNVAFRALVRLGEAFGCPRALSTDNRDLRSVVVSVNARWRNEAFVHYAAAATHDPSAHRFFMALTVFLSMLQKGKTLPQSEFNARLETWRSAYNDTV